MTSASRADRSTRGLALASGPIGSHLPGWHRVFHPIGGADPLTLARLLADGGPPSPGHLPRVVAALLNAAARAPASAIERARFALAPPPPIRRPVIILGHWRSGTTHLHNLLSRASRFAWLDPLAAGLPWDFRSMPFQAKALLYQYMPRTRLIDAMGLGPDLPQEDELPLTLMGGPSIYDAVLFPARFDALMRRALFFEGCGSRAVAAWEWRMRHLFGKLAGAAPGRTMLIKNPAHTSRVAALRRIWPDAVFIHIHRHPQDVFLSTRKLFQTLLDELALQRARVDLDAAILSLYPRIMDAAFTETADLPPSRHAVIAYDALDRDPLGVLARLYSQLELGDWPADRPSVVSYLAGLGPAPKRSHDRRDPSLGTVGDAWAGWIERLGYQPR